ncbi:MAG: hypothetical protein JNL82_31880 [Myxococcales bacterium]|nr:hypothetical protein [Myxococcales bacterium]
MTAVDTTDHEPAPIAEVIDLLDGAAALVRRSPTLDGSVPLRAARACTPLLAGNALGWQVALRDGVHARRRLGRWQLDPRGDPEPVRRRLAAALPVAVRRGLLREGSAWHRRLAAGPWWVESGALHCWTGLLVRATADAWLRVAPPANRRALDHVCATTWIPPSADPVPLVLRLTPSHHRDLELHGELATLAAFSPRHSIDERPLAAVPELAHAHLEFFDAAYFDRKRDKSTFKYRNHTRHKPPPAADLAPCTLAAAGPSSWSIVALGDRVDTPDGPDLPAPTTARVAALEVRNALDLAVHHDGLHVTAKFLNDDELAARARAIEAAFESLGPAVRARLAAHRGALWYFTKYFTPHVAGEPNFFVKPSALLTTPHGVATVLEGACNPTWDVLRGVVATDLLHVMPAVFRIHAPGDFEVPRGAPLLHAIPTPAALLECPLVRRALTW